MPRSSSVIHVPCANPAALEPKDKIGVMWEVLRALPLLSWPMVVQGERALWQ